MRDVCRIVVAALLVMSGLLLGGVAYAAEIRVFSSNAMTDLMTDLGPEFERATGHKVAAVYEPTSMMMNRIKGGESTDVIILLKQSINELQKGGKVVAGSE